MIPIADENPTIRTPWMTMALLAMMALVWVVVQGAGFDDYTLAASVCNLGLVPGEITGRAALGTAVPIGPGLACVVDNSAINWLTPVISLFLHGGWMHLLGNALFFWVFGNNVEDVMGRGRFLAFYLLCGVVASAAHVAVDPSSPVPTVGASGAISGIMGAYLVLFPRVRVRMLFPLFIIFPIIAFPAWAVLIYWFATQLLSGLPQAFAPNPEIAGGVAVWAHIGGFATGALLVKAFENPVLVARRRSAFAALGVPPG
jgi:membrane associated rhomboid family serine protease